MRGLRRTVLGLLATTVAAGVLAPTAASAATTAIHWENWGSSTLNGGDYVQVCTQSYEDFETGQTLVVQVKLDGVYATKKQIVIDGTQGNCIDVTPSDLVPRAGSYWFRAQFRPSPSAAVLTASIPFKLVTVDTRVDLDNSFQLFSSTATKNRRLTASVLPARGQTVELQRKWQGNWYTMSRAKAPVVESDYESGAVDLAVPTRAGNGTYRTVVRASKWTDQVISSSYTIHQTDYAKHSRYIASARSYIKRFCPSNPIYIDGPLVSAASGTNYLGLATGEWLVPFAGNSGYVKARIELRSGMPPAKLKSVALHECAHVAQFRANVENLYEVEQEKAWDLWKYAGHEGQADCMSYVWSGTTRYFGYVNSCTSTQMKNSRRMWSDYGVKYQANPYKWTVPSSAAASSGPAPEPVVVQVS